MCIILGFSTPQPIKTATVITSDRAGLQALDQDEHDILLIAETTEELESLNVLWTLVTSNQRGWVVMTKKGIASDEMLGAIDMKLMHVVADVQLPKAWESATVLNKVPDGVTAARFSDLFS